MRLSLAGAGWAALILAALGGAGCSLDYAKDQTTPPDQVPLMVFEGLKQTGVRDGRLLYTMESEKSELFQVKKEMRLNRFRFQEYDSFGQPASAGEAESAVIDTGSNDASINGRLTVRSDERKVTLSVDGGQDGGLNWRNEDRILTTRPDTGVTLSKDDGSRVEARGMTLDLGSNRLQLEEGVQGTWTPETNENADTAAAVAPPPGPDSGL